MGNDPSKQISEGDLDELRDNTAFSGSEIQDWYKKFHDQCPDGAMTKEQFMEMYAKMFPNGDVRRFADHIFKAYDVDGNGTIDFKEFLVTMNIASRGPIDDKLKWAFKLYDIDSNGYVTKSEATQIVKAIYKMRGMPTKSTGNNKSPIETVDEIFKQLDKNNDNKLSEFEFVMGAKSTPAILCVLQNTT